jgi:hypothetical protein
MTALVARTGLSAQSLRGHVLDAGTSEPIKGAFIRIVDSNGIRISGTVTNGAGLFSLNAAAAGEYKVRVERLGYRTFESAPFRLDSAAVRDFRIPAIAIELPSVASAPDTRCVSRTPMDRDAAIIWEEVRKGLTAASWTAQNVQVFFQMADRTTDYDTRFKPTGVESKDIITGLSRGTPFTAAPVDSLMRNGFIQKKTGGFTNYYGPDAELIMSDAFQQTHCFHATSDRSRPGLIGLAFEPAGDIKPADIRGSLWLDRATSRLVNLKFSYDHLTVDAPTGAAGGEVEFAQMDNGYWIVSGWTIRVPLMLDGRESKDERGAWAGVQERNQSVISAYIDEKLVYRALQNGGGK